MRVSKRYLCIRKTSGGMRKWKERLKNQSLVGAY